MTHTRSILNRRTGRRLTCGLAALVLAFGLAACEENSKNTEDGEGEAPEVFFRIDPQQATIGSNTLVVTFTAYDGQPPYEWTLSDGTLGSLSASGGLSAVVNYTPAAGQTGANTLRVTDANGWSASAVIEQP